MLLRDRALRLALSRNFLNSGFIKVRDEPFPSKCAFNQGGHSVHCWIGLRFLFRCIKRSDIRLWDLMLSLLGVFDSVFESMEKL